MASNGLRFRRYRSALGMAALLAAACGAEPPLAPPAVTVPAPPVAAPAPAFESWSLEQRMVSVAGAEICGWDRGGFWSSATWPLRVRRAGSVVRLVYGDIMDEIELVGILEGDAFTASSSTPSYQPCGGQRRDYILESIVAGRFSAAGDALTARETVSYRFASGEAIVFTFDWVATRR